MTDRKVLASTDGTGGRLGAMSHAGLHVADLERSLHFYRDVLGLEVAARWTRAEPYIRELVGHPDVRLHAAILRVPESEVFLELLAFDGVAQVATDPSTAPPGTGHVCFYVDDLDGLYARLSALGVPSVSGIVSPDVGPNRGGKAVYLLDPDGFRVELVETELTLAGEPRRRDDRT